jgi:hypothetical protein
MRKQRTLVPLKTRFESKVKITPGCWIWTGAKTGGGYGNIKHCGKVLIASRVSYELYCSAIPDGLHVLHKCDNPSCVNPDHLFLGTHCDNMHDMYHKNRREAATGERNGASKLTQQKVLLIRNDSRASDKVGADFGVSGCLIRKIRRSEIWAGH